MTNYRFLKAHAMVHLMGGGVVRTLAQDDPRGCVGEVRIPEWQRQHMAPAQLAHRARVLMGWLASNMPSELRSGKWSGPSGFHFLQAGEVVMG